EQEPRLSRNRRRVARTKLLGRRMGERRLRLDSLRVRPAGTCAGLLDSDPGGLGRYWTVPIAVTDGMIGSTLAHYRSLERLGAGGMGEVYLAEDARLKRRLALKVLPAALASDTEYLRRFEREAEAIAALNHPNIVTIYSVEEIEGVRCLTM